MLSQDLIRIDTTKIKMNYSILIVTVVQQISDIVIMVT